MLNQLKQSFFFVLMCFALIPSPVFADGVVKLPNGVTQLSTVEGITEYRLTNGLTVLLMPDLSKPTVTVNVTYLVGSRHENYGETGMAHLLEHMMFKGTPAIPKIDVEFNQRGMNSNASTTLDYTNYFEQFAASDSNLQWAIKMEADRMVHSTIAQKDLDSEMTVVRNEYEQGENSPINVLMKRLQSVTFNWHNYGHAPIGNRSDIENVKIENLQAFYRLYYQPDNAVLLITGKFDVNKTLGWVASDFGAIPKPKRSLPKFWTVEPTQDGERNFVVRSKGDTKIVMVAYKIPADLHPDNDAISFAADILSDNPTGRLHKILVDSGKAVDVFSTSIGSYAPGMQIFGAVVKKEDSVEVVRDILVDAIEGFANSPPTNEEMERMKRNYLNQDEKTLADPEIIGLELSEAIALGDWRYFFQHRDQLVRETSKQVSTASANYFKRDNRVVGMFIPEDKLARAEIPPAPLIKEAMQHFTPKRETRISEIFDPSPGNIDKRTLRNIIGGLNVATLVKKNKGETVSVALTLHWGDEKSLFGKKMISEMTENILMRGNKKYTREQLNDEFAKLKIVGNIYHFDTTRNHLVAALALIAQVLKEPSFPENEFVQLKKQMLSNLESKRNDPSTLAIDAVGQHFNHYPKGDWRASEMTEEKIESINSIKLEDLREFHKKFYGASKGELTIVGDVDVAASTKVIKQAFGHWISKATYARIEDTYTDIAPIQININTPEKENGFYLAKMSINLNDEDPQYPALVVANYLFGGGAELNSRLLERIRQKDGLSYSGSSSLRVNALNNAANFQITAISAPQNLTKVAVAVHEELSRVLKEGFSAEEVERAKSGLKQQALQLRSQDESLVLEINHDQYLHRTLAWTQAFENKVNALTVEQVNAVFRKRIDPNKLTVAIAGDQAKMEVKK